MSLEQPGTPQDQDNTSLILPERSSTSLSRARPERLDSSHSGVSAPKTGEPPAKALCDPARILEALLRQWHWLLFGAIAISALGAIWGYATGPYTAVVQLIRNSNSVLASD